MRTWFLTNHTYGTWLPGQPGGSVTSVRDRRPEDPDVLTRVEHDRPGEPVEGYLPGLYANAREQMKGPPIYLDREQAERILSQFQETAAHRGWTLIAVSVMASHFHLVVQVPDDPEPGRVLGDFKGYASRILNRTYGKPASATWWTSEGSKRKVRDEAALAAIIHYVLYEQENPLLVWSSELGRIV